MKDQTTIAQETEVLAAKLRLTKIHTTKIHTTKIHTTKLRTTKLVTTKDRETQARTQTSRMLQTKPFTIQAAVYRTKALIGLLMVALLVAACGSGTPSGTTQEPGNAQSGEPGQTTAATKTVTTVNGEITIPAEPKRVVAAYYVGELAALGIQPAGTVTRLLGAKSPHLAPYTKQTADIGAEPNLEAVTALDPDLIVAFDLGELKYEDYAKIAPTVIIPWSNDDVWAKLRSVSKLFGKEAEAEAYIAQYEKKAEQARKAIEGSIGKDETAVIIRFFGKAIRVYGGRDIGHALYSGLQLNPPPLIRQAMEQDAGFTSTRDVSLEEIPNYAADRIFVVVTDEDGDRAYREAQKMALWSSLPAVKAGRVYELPADKWFTYDPISVQATLEEAVQLLTTKQ